LRGFYGSGYVNFGMLTPACHHRRYNNDFLGSPRYGPAKRIVQTWSTEFVESHDHLTPSHLAQLRRKLLGSSMKRVVLDRTRPGTHFGIEFHEATLKRRALGPHNLFHSSLQAKQFSHLAFRKIIRRHTMHNENDDSFHESSFHFNAGYRL
jgi:hypothetical protein